eukprot:m.82516 g.82516  ORF g.82516 m.82516 type:complete len:713 (-) comp14618_c0_seq1:94-2232(-)
MAERPSFYKKPEWVPGAKGLAVDQVKNWCPAIVRKVDREANTAVIHFINWPRTYDLKVKIGDERVHLLSHKHEDACYCCGRTQRCSLFCLLCPTVVHRNCLRALRRDIGTGQFFYCGANEYCREKSKVPNGPLTGIKPLSLIEERGEKAVAAAKAVKAKLARKKAQSRTAQTNGDDSQHTTNGAHDDNPELQDDASGSDLDSDQGDVDSNDIDEDGVEDGPQLYERRGDRGRFVKVGNGHPSPRAKMPRRKPASRQSPSQVSNGSRVDSGEDSDQGSRSSQSSGQTYVASHRQGGTSIDSNGTMLQNESLRDSGAAEMETGNDNNDDTDDYNYDNDDSNGQGHGSATIAPQNSPSRRLQSISLQNDDDDDEDDDEDGHADNTDNGNDKMDADNTPSSRRAPSPDEVARRAEQRRRRMLYKLTGSDGAFHTVNGFLQCDPDNSSILGSGKRGKAMPPDPYFEFDMAGKEPTHIDTPLSDLVDRRLAQHFTGYGLCVGVVTRIIDPTREILEVRFDDGDTIQMHRYSAVNQMMKFESASRRNHRHRRGTGDVGISTRRSSSKRAQSAPQPRPRAERDALAKRPSASQSIRKGVRSGDKRPSDEDRSKEVKSGGKRPADEDRPRPQSKAAKASADKSDSVPNRASYWERQVDQLEKENEMLRESETRLEAKVDSLEEELELLRAQAETTKRAVAVLFDAAHSDLQEALTETADED